MTADNSTIRRILTEQGINPDDPRLERIRVIDQYQQQVDATFRHTVDSLAAALVQEGVDQDEAREVAYTSAASFAATVELVADHDLREKKREGGRQPLHGRPTDEQLVRDVLEERAAWGDRRKRQFCCRKVAARHKIERINGHVRPLSTRTVERACDRLGLHPW